MNEQHLAGLLRDFNRATYLDYVIKTKRIVSTCNEQPGYPTISEIKTADMGGDLAFRTASSFPVYIMLSHPICRFRSHRNYPIRENFYIANLGLVPVFFSSMNTMSVLKLWGERATGFFNPTNSPLMDSSTVCWELPQVSRPAEYSSMNFIVQNGADPQHAEPYLAEIFEKYFKIGYWNFPKVGFSPSTHFLHGRTAISSQVKIWKSLFIAREIGNSEKIQVEGKTIEGIWLRLQGLAVERGQYFFKNTEVLVDIDLASQMLPRENLGASFINGIVAEVRQREGPTIRRRSLMEIVADYGESYYDILTALIGILADAKYSEGKSIVDIGTLENLREQVHDLYVTLYRHLRVQPSLSEHLSNVFDVALRYVFPVLVIDGPNVLYVHPLVWSLLKKWDLIRKDQVLQTEILLHLLRLLKLSENEPFMKLFLDENADYFAEFGLKKSDLLRSVFELAKEIRLCKMTKEVLDIEGTIDVK